ncbi:type I glutamate--ammonia ligase [Streptomyces angustmyceticus]|uniref:hypothetical protein n=1 Tax=Streptomyces angustmyceticus TaxID=285578 RepID=UPI0021AF1FA5|nr:hypothetical protein [Streptomyces angustmyceticus]
MTPPAPADSGDRSVSLPTPAVRRESDRPAAGLTLDRLREHVAAGRVDTVLLAVPDLQGRLKGKRYGAQHFLDRLAAGSADMCAYVLATDVDMTPADGFALTSWATGYQDLRVTPAIETLRLTPWVPKSALVLGDAVVKHHAHLARWKLHHHRIVTDAERRRWLARA